jgi:hypothetical protein
LPAVVDIVLNSTYLAQANSLSLDKSRCPALLIDLIFSGGLTVKSFLKKRSKQLSLLQAALAVAVLLTVSCGNPAAVKQIGAFSDGMDLVLKNTAAAFDTIEARHYDRKVAIKVNEFDRSGINLNNVSIEPFFPKKDLAARTLVINGLREYAASLKAVMSDEKLKEFDDKTKAFGKQLTDLNDATVKANILNSKDVSAQQINIFTTAINTIGHWMVDRKREKVTKQTVKEMKDAVRQVCSLLAQDVGDTPHKEGSNDLDPAPGKAGLRKKLWKDYSDIIRNRGLYLERNASSFSAADKRKEIEYLIGLVAERQRADETLAAVKKGLEAIPAAHDKLERAFDEKDTSLSGYITRLFEEGERIREFYEGLSKK